MDTNMIEKRGSLENPVTPLSYPAEWLMDIFNGGRTDSGIRVSELTALQASAVFAAVNIISSAIAMLPLGVYSQKLNENGRLWKEENLEHEVYDLLHSEPNIEMTSFTWRRTMMAHALLWGNGYSELQRNKRGDVMAIWPRNPARTRPIRLSLPTVVQGQKCHKGQLIYMTAETMTGVQIETTDAANDDVHEMVEGKYRFILPQNMLHLHGLSLDGRLGADIVELARQNLGLALAMEKYGAKFFGNGAVPQGILTTPQSMDDPELETLRRSWHESQGGENARKVAILERGMTYQPIASDNKAGQLLEARQFQTSEIAAIFCLPAHMLTGKTERMSSDTAEQMAAAFLNYCLRPWIVAFEQELDRRLVEPPKAGHGMRDNAIHFDIHDLVYPDAKSRATLYDGGRLWGYMSGNDVRALEGMNPAEVPDLKDPSINAMDRYYIGTNMAPIEAVTSLTDVSPNNKTPDGAPHAGGSGSVSGGSAVGQGK
jgi:HK97 family phage portal protein